MRLDSIIVRLRQYNQPPLPSGCSRRTNRLRQPSTPDDHSPLAPPLPIPNRTVKRRRADDSTDYPCESRSLSGTPQTQKPTSTWAFVLGKVATLSDPGSDRWPRVSRRARPLDHAASGASRSGMSMIAGLATMAKVGRLLKFHLATNDWIQAHRPGTVAHARPTQLPSPEPRAYWPDSVSIHDSFRAEATGARVASALIPGP